MSIRPPVGVCPSRCVGRISGTGECEKTCERKRGEGHLPTGVPVENVNGQSRVRREDELQQ